MTRFPNIEKRNANPTHHKGARYVGYSATEGKFYIYGKAGSWQATPEIALTHRTLHSPTLEGIASQLESL